MLSHFLDLFTKEGKMEKKGTLITIVKVLSIVLI